MPTRNMASFIGSFAVLLLIGATFTVEPTQSEPLARSKRDHDTHYEYSSSDEAKMSVIADIISNFFHERGCSTKDVQQLLSQQCHGKQSKNDDRATFKLVLKNIESLPEETIFVLERKVQYGSVVVTVLSDNSVSGSDGKQSFRFRDFMYHLESSDQKYRRQKSSSQVIKYIVKNMYEVESTSYIQTSFHSLIEVTYGSKHKGKEGKKGKHKHNKSHSKESSDSSSSSSKS